MHHAAATEAMDEEDVADAAERVNDFDTPGSAI